MGFVKRLSHLLPFSQVQQPFIEPSTLGTFTLEVWLQNFPLNHQAVSWYPADNNSGHFGIEVRGPLDPLPREQRAVFLRDSGLPEFLFFKPAEDSAKKEQEPFQVIVQTGGSVEYTADKFASVSKDHWDSYTGNFSTVDFTYWPDRSTVYAVEFEPPGIDMGVFLACPDPDIKIYRLFAMTPTFSGGGGCITLDWLVHVNVEDTAL